MEHEHQREWAQTLRNDGPQKQDKRHATREAEQCIKALLGKGQCLSAQPAEHLFPEKDFPCDRNEAHSKLDFGPVCAEWEHFQACKINPSNKLEWTPNKCIWESKKD